MENYRPISLLSVGYKVLAAIILQRLQNCGAEDRLCDAQFGFRPGRNTNQPLFIARRMIDEALKGKDGSLFMLVLDWSKAFDRLRPDALQAALARFGVPAGMVEMIRSIYTDRTFCVRDSGHVSSTRRQAAGIAQGCPLSPYLFIIVMSVLISDVRDKKHAHNTWARKPYVVTEELLYADDTMLIASDPHELQLYFDLVAEEGRKYGLELNMEKPMLLRVRSETDIIGTDRLPVKCCERIVYLGGLLCSDARPAPEVARRMGEARCAFEKVARVWSHTNISRHSKIEILDSLVLSKLLYGLESLFLYTADRARIDGFYCRCLRRIFKIPVAFVSRVSNARVYQLAEAKTHPADYNSVKWSCTHK